MSSTRDILNKVLIGLRQTQITETSTADAYELLLLQFVNEAKEEVEEAWDWYAIRKTITVTLTAGTSDYALTAAGPADIDTTERSKLLYERQGGGESSSRTFGSTPQVFDVTDSAEFRLAELSQETMERLHFTDDDGRAAPKWFSIYSDGVSQKMTLYPIPEKTRTLKVRMINPQAALAATSLDSTTLLVPFRPVWTKSLFLANEERGSELARPGGSNFLSAQDSLAVAISREQNIVDITGVPQ